MRDFARRFAVASETAFALPSFLAHRLIRFAVRLYLRHQDAAGPGQSTSWQILDRQVISNAARLLVVMANAPRWNTHALIAMAGPLQIEHAVRIHAATADSSASAWTIGVHAEPTQATVASTGSIDSTAGQSWSEIQLPPGRYRLILRYYQWSSQANLPEIQVDDTLMVNSAKVPTDSNDFYQWLAGRRSLLYTCMHSYVRTLLRFHQWLPRWLVEREYLPAGNPQTTFLYGVLHAGTKLIIRTDIGLNRTYYAFFTAYNRSSLPAFWFRLTEREHVVRHVSVDGSYLLRIVPRISSCEGAQATINCREEKLDQDVTGEG